MKVQSLFYSLRVTFKASLTTAWMEFPTEGIASHPHSYP